MLPSHITIFHGTVQKLQLQCAARCRGLRVSCKSQLIEHSGSAVELSCSGERERERKGGVKRRKGSLLIGSQQRLNEMIV